MKTEKKESTQIQNFETEEHEDFQLANDAFV